MLVSRKCDSVRASFNKRDIALVGRDLLKEDLV